MYLAALCCCNGYYQSIRITLSGCTKGYTSGTGSRSRTIEIKVYSCLREREEGILAIML
jgi:hypothetical protein